jgi:transcription antitermination factor NusG
MSRDRDWCILRTSPGRTLGVAAALREGGFDVWTPIVTEVRREGRSRKRVDHDTALTPSFIFARWEHRDQLASMSMSPAQTYQVWDKELRRMVTQGIPQFTLFRHLGAYPPIADRALEPLRRIERAAKPKSKVRTFQAGEAVQYPDAGFEGLIGTVEGLQGRYALVSFPGFPIVVQIDARHLLPLQQAA